VTSQLLEGTEAVHRVPDDAVLMGVEMPVMVVLEATRVIRRYPIASAQTQIVAMTASDCSKTDRPA